MSEREADQLLVERVQQGDKKAFELLVVKYHRKIIRLISRLIRDHAEVEDVAQDAFIKAYRALPQFRGESAFYTWLYRIAINTARNWLAAQGHRVLGVEISPLAVEQFFAEAGISPQRHAGRLGEHWSAGGIEIVCGDAFALRAEDLAEVAGLYDRGAMVALPADLRQRYVDNLYAALPAGCRGLLLTLEYPPQEMDGPPFSVDEAEVRARLAGWSPQLLERRDLLASEQRYRDRGLSAMHTAAWRLQRG